MFTKDEKNYLSKIPDKKVRIFPFDPKATLLAGEIIQKVKTVCPDLRIIHMGASALGISGQKDIDIYAFSDPKDFLGYLPKLVKVLGQPERKRADHIDWKFKKTGYQVEFYLTDPNSESMKRQIRVFKILKSNKKLCREYERLKEKFDGKSYKQYQIAKYEFYHQILGTTKADNALDFEIVEYQNNFKSQVIDLVGRELRSWKVLPYSDKPITDDDLYHILKIYSGRSRFWVALRKKEVIGTVGVRELGKSEAKISRMFVLDKYHGKGVGQALLDKAIAFAKKKGYKELVLNTHPLLTRAHRFYQKNGFVFEGKSEDRLHFRLML